MTPTTPTLRSTVIEYGERATLHIEDVYSTTVEDLWSAVTDPERLSRWIATVTGDVRVGGDFHIHFTSTADGPGRVESCDPPHAFAVRLDPDTSQESRLSVRLTPEDGGTRLTVEEAGGPTEDKIGYSAGWQVHLEDLTSYLAGRTPEPWKPRWQQLMPAYEELFGRPDGPRLIGSLRDDAGVGVLRLEDSFATDIDDLWSALTDPERLARWLGEFEGDLRLGGTFHNRMFASGAEGNGRIVECDPPRRFVVEMSGETGNSETLTAALTADGDQTVLAIEHRGLPVEMLPGYGAGTQIHFEDLGAYLAGLRRCESDARMETLYPAYKQVPIS